MRNTDCAVILNNGLDSTSSITNVLNRIFKFELPIVDLEFVNFVKSFKYVLFEITYDYTEATFFDFLQKQYIPPVVDDRIRNGTAGILITLQKESYFYLMPDIHRWLDIRGYPTNSMFYVTGSMNAKVVYDQMYDDSRLGGRGKINVIRFAQCELYLDGATTLVPHFSTQPLDKKFICLNRVSKPHRLATLAFLKKAGIFDQCFFSYIDPPTVELAAETAMYTRNLVSIADMEELTTPIFLDYTEVPGNIIVNDCNPTVNSPIEPYFRNSLFSIVNETFQMDYNSQYKNLPFVFPTDKVYKTFYFYHLPIVNGGAMIVDYLRRSGFDMFDDIIDHSYDTILDGPMRLASVFAEIERINNKYTLADCTQLKASLRTRLEENNRILRLREGKLFNTVIADLEEALLKLDSSRH
jgi:hypothetical protein